MKRKKEKMSIIAGVYNENALIKSYLEENKLNLYEILKMWDFKNNKTIMYRHLKDALLVRGFNFNSTIRDMIVNIALKFVIDHQNLKDNLDKVLINYEALCLEFV